MNSLHITHPLVIAMAKNQDISVYSAMALLTAQECGIKEHEMGTFIEAFNYHMDDGITVLGDIEMAKKAVDSIELALSFTIADSINIQNIVTKTLK